MPILARSLRGAATPVWVCRAFLCSAIFCLLPGCGEADAEGEDSAAAPTREGVSLLDFNDPRTGMVQHRAPYPQGWRYDDNPNDQLVMTGPNGIEVYQSNSGQILYSNDPFALQTAQSTGAQIAPVMPLEQYLQQQFEPYMRQREFRLTGHSPLPQIKQIWELFAAAMPQGLSAKEFGAIGAEWENSNGARAFTILVHSVFHQNNFVNWSVSANELYAPESEYENAKEVYLYASRNLKVNPQWQIAKNNELLTQIRADRQMWDERTRQSRIQHLQRMNAILARGDAASTVAKTNSDILDISHQGYLKRSDLVSAGQAKTVDMIAEQAVITNPGTGEYYKVDSGYRNYWVNAEGRYLSTDNSLFDPRTDQRLNGQQWERFEVLE